MTIDTTHADVAVVAPVDGRDDSGSYVDWPAIFAGAVITVAIALVLHTFGSAIGLGSTALDEDGFSPAVFVVASGVWFVAVAVLSTMTGAYLAGRMRRRWHDSTEDECDVRDGTHGLAVWAVALVFSALLAASGAMLAAKTAVSATADVAAASIESATDLVPESADPYGYTVDTLVRVDPEETVGSASSTRQELANIMARVAIEGELSDADRDYAASLIAARTSLDRNEAEARIDAAVVSIYETAADAAEAAETARKMGILIAFFTAATMVVSAAAAWWAAGRGGRHRDEGTQFLVMVGWR